MNKYNQEVYMKVTLTVAGKVTTVLTGSNVAFRISDIYKLFRSKNRFYLDLFRSYAKKKKQGSTRWTAKP
jgi:hypothetical protein